jgi:hypothetical protein
LQIEIKSKILIDPCSDYHFCFDQSPFYSSIEILSYKSTIL